MSCLVGAAFMSPCDFKHPDAMLEPCVSVNKQYEAELHASLPIEQLPQEERSLRSDPPETACLQVCVH